MLASMTKKKAKKAEVANGDLESVPAVQTQGGTPASSTKKKKPTNGIATEPTYPASSLLICRNK